ncbi:uncharacterized protein [Triticum aestivum]|uniref:uncharacterized protein n=1 Tax=Triticum aestivum TaxID=4565 RepID=UPI001D023F0A|nr:uncharacterized protein LOC123100634 [Triticum aestivum]
MEPILREPGAYPPEYVTSEEFTHMFSVEFEHDGLFTGLGDRRKYEGCTHDVFDYYHTDNWSIQVMNDCLEKIGYDTADPNIHVYWCMPEITSILDGLVCVDNFQVIAAMNSASREQKTLYLLVLDEKDHIWCDVVIKLP